MKSFNERVNDIMRRAETPEKTPVYGTIARRATVLGLCSVLALAVGITLFMPLKEDGFALTASSEYYGVASVVRDLTYNKKRYNNNFEKLCASFSDSFSGCGSNFGYNASGTAPMPEGDMNTASPDSANKSEYVETTDNQVNGVIEGDILKRTTTHAFYYSASMGTITAYSFGDGEIKKVGSFEISANDKTFYKYSADGEIYISDDGKILTLFTTCYSPENSLNYACGINVDINSPADMREITRYYSSGKYVTSRKTNGEFLLVSNFRVRYNPNFKNEFEYLPQAGAIGALTTLPASNIIYSKAARSANYTVVTKLKSDLGVGDNSSYAFLAYSDEIYASRDSIYLTSVEWETPAGATSGGNDNTAIGMTSAPVDAWSSSVVTNIACVGYGSDNLTLTGSVKINGRIHNRYSMDEFGGNLRVVVDVTEQASAAGGSSYRGSSLYAVSLNDFKVKPLLTKFSPNGEIVQSVRFYGTKVYVCTAEVITFTDPVYVIDISDYDNVTYNDTGTIKGYSIALRRFKDETFLGIGYGEARNEMKISVYEEGASTVTEVGAYKLYADFSQNYKSYFIDADKGLVGLAAYVYEKNETVKQGYKYLLMQYTGYEMILFDAVDVYDGGFDWTRAFFVDGYLYIFTPTTTSVINYCNK